MKIAQLKLLNFRSYEDVTIDFANDFNIIIGKNDIGKSTILEAMEIFFNNDIVKIDINDLNVFSKNKTMSIQVSFIPNDTLYTIDTIPTDLSNEYLLDKNGYLTIKKTWDCSKEKLNANSLKTTIISNYPDNFDTPLVNLKIVELKKLLLEKYAKDLDVTSIKKNTCADIRQAIYSSINNINLKEIEIDIDKEDGKKIWGALQSDLPLFFLFQSDRENRDSDKEVQTPLKAITKTAIDELKNELDEVKRKIIHKATKIGEDTLGKLKEMSPEIANVLIPEMTSKSWDNLFSFSFNCDNGIPVNKRGSGVRRLILLNYFRAEAERKTLGNSNTIYAIEEPETSQHPEWQIKLFQALMDLPKNERTQVIVTTHSPSLASLCPINKIIFLFKNDGKINIQTGDYVDLNEVSSTLGVLPNIPSQLKVILCLEGPTDVEFFDNICGNFDVDINSDPRIMSLSLGGGSLINWVNSNYLRKLNLPEIHIYDGDVEKYATSVIKVNSRPNCWAVQTKMREIENYIHPKLYNKIYPIQKEFINLTSDWRISWPNRDIPKEFSEFLKLEKKEEGNIKIKNESTNKIKEVFSSELSKLMTKELFEDLGAYDEVNGWFEKIKEYINKTS